MKSREATDERNEWNESDDNRVVIYFTVDNSLRFLGFLFPNFLKDTPKDLNIDLKKLQT